MNNTVILVPLILLACAVGCKDERAERPAPQEMSAEAKAEFCGMALNEHPGPKGQLFLRGQDKPIWFASVRDAFAFTLLPEMPKTIVAIYVTDMGRARDWRSPEPGTWVDARDANYVIGSRRRAGMDTDEAVPFSDGAAAHRFAAENGGRVVRFSEMPVDYIFPERGNGS
jgi:copper chaperone NosL